VQVNQSHEEFWFDENRWVISYGGAGSGKSFTTAQKILTRLVSEENHRFLIVRKVAKTLRPSVFQLFKDVISTAGLTSQFKVNKSDMTITNTMNDSMLLFFGLDDIEKLKSIQGITSIWIEEASECDKGDIMELNRRLRGFTPYYKQIIITFNPISHLHWLKEHFFDNPNMTASRYKTTYLDNAFIDDEYKTEIEDIRHYDIQQYNIYALGEWGVLNTNIIYFNYKYQEHTTDKTVDDFDVLHVGLDFNIAGCVVIVGGEINNTMHIVDVIISHDTQAIVDDLVRYADKKVLLYPDMSSKARKTNSSRSDLDILIQAKYKIIRLNNDSDSNGRVRNRINAVNKKLADSELLLNTSIKGVQRLSHALQSHAYNEKTGEPEKEDAHIKGSIDDFTDSLGYMIGRRYPIKGQKTIIHKGT